MTFAAGQKVRFHGRNHAGRAREFAIEFKGVAEHNGSGSIVTLAEDIDITAKSLRDFGLPARRAYGSERIRHAMPPRGKRDFGT